MLNESVFVLSQNMSGEHSCEEQDVNSQLSQDRVVEDTNTSQDLPQDDLAEQSKKISRAEIPAGKILVHNAQGSYLMDEMKWPTLTLANKMMLNLMDAEHDYLSSENGSSLRWISSTAKTKSKCWHSLA